MLPLGAVIENQILCLHGGIGGAIKYPELIPQKESCTASCAASSAARSGARFIEESD